MTERQLIKKFLKKYEMDYEGNYKVNIGELLTLYNKFLNLKIKSKVTSVEDKKTEFIYWN